MIETAILEYFHGDDLAASSWINKYRNNSETISVFFDRIVDKFSKYDRHTNYDENLSDMGRQIFNILGKDERKALIRDYLTDFKHIIPGGSALAGIGTSSFTSLSNCFVIKSPDDNIEDIFNTGRDIAQIFKRRGGVGIDLSNLRPCDAIVNNSSKTSTGITSWMRLYSTITEIIGQNGRRGAMLLSIDVRHPDIFDFIRIKQDLSKITGANVSVRVNDDFMAAVEKDEDYFLTFPCGSVIDNYIIPAQVPYNQLQKTSNVYWKKIRAKELWDELTKCVWTTGEPGILNWNRLIDYDPSGIYPEFKPVSTNPCGELPLSPYDSCRLIASILYSLVDNPFTKDATIDRDKAYKIFYITHVLADIFVDLEVEAVDNILKKIDPDYNNQLAYDSVLSKSAEFKLWLTIRSKAINGRRTGTGITGYADMLAALDKPYGEHDVTKNVFYTKLEAELDASIDLAIMNGPFKAWDPILEKDGNDWYRFIEQEYPEQWTRMQRFGRRNISLSTIPPGGTTSLLVGTSTGIEPVFELYYTRRRACNPNEIPTFVDQNGRGFVEYNVIHSKFITWYKIFNNIPYDESRRLLEAAPTEELDIYVMASPWFCQTSSMIDTKLRVQTQALIQKYITSSISSTVNIPQSAEVKEVNDIYLDAFDSGCKGITVYRDKSRSGILIKSEQPAPQIILKRPEIIDCKVLMFKNEKKDWIAFVGEIDGQPYELFTGPRDIEVFPVPSSITSGKIIRVKPNENERSRYDFSYTDAYGYENRLGGLSRVFSQEYYNYGRFTSSLLRGKYEITEIIRIIDGLEFGTKTLNNWKSGVIRSLKAYIPDGTDAGIICSECGGRIVYEGGCYICKDCGNSKCG